MRSRSEVEGRKLFFLAETSFLIKDIDLMEIFGELAGRSIFEIQILFDFCDRLLPGNFASNGKVFFHGRNCFVTTEKNFLNEPLILGIALNFKRLARPSILFKLLE